MNLTRNRYFSILKILVKCFGFIIFLIILSRIDYYKIKEIIGSGHHYLLYLAFIIIAISFALSAGRYHIILKGQGIHIPFSSALEVYLLSFFWGLVSPGRIGTASRIAYLYDHDVPFAKGVSNILLEKSIDAVCVFIYLYLSVIILSTKLSTVFLELVFYFSAGLILFILLAFLKRKVIIEKLSGFKIRGYDIIDTFKSVFYLKHWYIILVLSLGLWGIYFYCLYLISTALLFDLPFFTIVFCVSSSSFISLIPISIAGIGTRDAWLIFIFKWCGYEAEKAVLFSSFFLLIYIEDLLLSSTSLIFSPAKSIKKN